MTAPILVLKKIVRLFDVYFNKRVSFTHENVVNARTLPEFSNRLYWEVKLLHEALKNCCVDKSLEIGCGYGRLTPYIAEHSKQHYAIEPELSLLNDAKVLHPNVRFYEAKAQKMPFPNDFFDLCVSWTVLQHIFPNDLTKAINEIKRVCTSKAIIILAEGIGKRASSTYWEHTLEEWKLLFPYNLTWYSERKIEETFKGNAGLVMRFEQK